MRFGNMVKDLLRTTLKSHFKGSATRQNFPKAEDRLPAPRIAFFAIFACSARSFSLGRAQGTATLLHLSLYTMLEKVAPVGTLLCLSTAAQ